MKKSVQKITIKTSHSHSVFFLLGIRAMGRYSFLPAQINSF